MVVNILIYYLDHIVDCIYILLRVMDAEERKILFFSSYIISIKNGISMNTPNIIRSMPIAKKTVLLLFIFDAEVI